MWLAGPWGGQDCAEERAAAGGFPLGFHWSPRPSGRLAEPHLAGFVHRVSAMCPHRGKGLCLNGGFGVGWPPIRSCPVPHVGRGSMGRQAFLGWSWLWHEPAE